MKTLTTFASLLLLITSFSVSAQDPVVGVEDPESLFVDSNIIKHRNKQAALHIMRELLQCNQWDRADEWLTDAYIQHNPNAASGLAGVVYFFTEVMNRPRVDNCDELTTDVVSVQADGPYVTVMMPRVYDNPNVPGEQYYTTWFDTWRFVDGKADEHWDPATITPAAP